MDRAALQRFGVIGVGTIGAVLVAFILGGVLLWTTGHNAFEVYRQMFSYGTEPQQLLDAAKRSGPLIMSACAVAVGFKMNLFNIGVEGQFRVALLLAAVAGAAVKLPGPLHVAFIFVVAMAAGAAYAGIAALLKVWRGVNEVIATIMLNAIALGLTGWLFQSFFKSTKLDSSGRPSLDVRTAVLPESAWLGNVFSGSAGKLSWYFVFALVVAFVVWLVVFRSTFGFQLRSSGLNPVAARTAGIDSKKMVVRAMLFSGALAGLVGMQSLMVDEHSYRPGLGTGLGFVGIAVALLGRNHPGGIVLAGLLFGFLQASSGILQLQEVPKSIVDIIQGIVVLTVVIVNEAVSRWYEKRTQRGTSKALDRGEALV
ncbi:ABC transporter permease [Nakamurella antarctica]|nr:ABC transporter permease [Nakamurella antarctica]